MQSAHGLRHGKFVLPLSSIPRAPGYHTTEFTSAWDSVPPFGAVGTHVMPHVAQKDSGRRWKWWRGQREVDEGPGLQWGAGLLVCESNGPKYLD